MYAHGKVWDAVNGEYVEVGNSAPEAVSRDAAAAARDKRPQQYFLTKEQADNFKADTEPKPPVEDHNG